MNIIQIGIYDKDKDNLSYVCDFVKRQVKKLFPRNVKIEISEFLKGEDIMKSMSEVSFDLLFLDIEVPEKYGYGLVEKLHKINYKTKVVLITCNENYVFDSFDWDILWFVRKSNFEKDSIKALKKYLRKFPLTSISYKWNSEIACGVILLQDILYFECNQHKIEIKTVQGDFNMYGSLKKIEEELENCNFLRIHRNYLVNQLHISNIKTRTAELINGIELDIAKNRKKELEDKMVRYKYVQ